MDENSEYIKGVENLANRLITYFSHVPGSTAPALVTYTVEEIKKELLEKERIKHNEI